MLSNISPYLTKIQSVCSAPPAWVTNHLFPKVVFDRLGRFSLSKQSIILKLLVFSIACTATAAYATTGISHRVAQSSQASHGNVQTSAYSFKTDADQDGQNIPHLFHNNELGVAKLHDINTVKTPTLYEDAINDFIKGETYLIEPFLYEEEALQLIIKAARLGYSFAELRIGLLYITGNKIEKNSQEGLKWIMKSASQENAMAQMFMGALFYSGKFVKKDYIKAYLWMTLAAKQGNKTAETYLETITDKMTPEQLAKAEKMAYRQNLAQTR
ncbi:MAG: sel1 repeat family protein [Magnetococcus sp. YQC-3]